MDWKPIIAAILSAVIGATGGGIAGNSSAVAECGVLLEQQRAGFQTTLAEIVRQIGG